MRAQTILFLLVDRVKGKLNCRPYRGGGEGNPKRLVVAVSRAFSNRSNIFTIRVLRTTQNRSSRVSTTRSCRGIPHRPKSCAEEKTDNQLFLHVLSARTSPPAWMDTTAPSPVGELPIHSKIIRTCCNAIQTLLQLNSNNYSSCDVFIYFAVATCRNMSRLFATNGGI